jgi:hypothetical protein
MDEQIVIVVSHLSIWRTCGDCWSVEVCTISTRDNWHSFNSDHSYAIPRSLTRLATPANLDSRSCCCRMNAQLYKTMLCIRETMHQVISQDSNRQSFIDLRRLLRKFIPKNFCLLNLQCIRRFGMMNQIQTRDCVTVFLRNALHAYSESQSEMGWWHEDEVRLKESGSLVV